MTKYIVTLFALVLFACGGTSETSIIEDHQAALPDAEAPDGFDCWHRSAGESEGWRIYSQSCDRSAPTRRAMSAVQNRNARHVAAKAMQLAAHVATGTYQRQLAANMRGVHHAYVTEMEPHLNDVAKGHLFPKDRNDAAGLYKYKKALDDLHDRIDENLMEHAYDSMAEAVNVRNHAAAKKLLGITPSQSGVAEHIAKARAENISLVTKAANAYAQDVEDIFSDPDTFGLTVEELQDPLLERGNVSESRAELMARDQTTKLNGSLNRIRQGNAGIESYVWSTSEDERVRDSDAELDGQTFRWDDPPVVDDEVSNPSEPIQCRCIALPVLEGDEDDEPSEDDDEDAA